MDEDLKQRMEKLSSRFEDALEAFVKTDPLGPVANLHDGISYALGLDQPDPLTRGKRIRPALCLLTCEALDGDIEAALPFALSVELMHNYFLVHDDIEDGDSFRRGRPAVWKQYGLAHGINIGDYLYTKVFTAFLSAGAEVDPVLRAQLLELLVDTLEHTHVGQTLDMNALKRRDVTVDDYLEIVTNKTAYYLAAPMLGGAVVAGADEGVFSAIRSLGFRVGPVFQVVDDTIDLTEGKGRESAGNDVREGKRSFLVAHAANAVSDADRDRLFDILDKSRDDTTDEDVDWVRDLFEECGAVQAGRVWCEEQMAEAREILAGVPAALRETLLGVFNALLDRRR